MSFGAKKPQVELEIVNQEGPEIIKGDTYTLFSWTCDAIIDGEEVSAAKIKTFDKEVSDAIEGGGWKGKAEVNVFKGKTEFVIHGERKSFTKKSFGGRSSDGGRPSGGGVASGGYSKPAYTPPASYTLEEFERLFDHCFEKSGITLDGTSATVQDRCALTATLLIGAQKCGIKIKE